MICIYEFHDDQPEHELWHVAFEFFDAPDDPGQRSRVWDQLQALGIRVVHPKDNNTALCEGDILDRLACCNHGVIQTPDFKLTLEIEQ